MLKIPFFIAMPCHLADWPALSVQKTDFLKIIFFLSHSGSLVATAGLRDRLK